MRRGFVFLLFTLWCMCACMASKPAEGVGGPEETGVRPAFMWNLDFRSVFDNRECDDRYTSNRTYFFTQLSPEIGIAVRGGRHRVMGGVVWTQPIGCEWEGHKIQPRIYYMYKVPRWEFAMGILPKDLLIRPLPNYIESDSAGYFQRSVRGAMVQHRSRQWYFEAMIDWRGMQSHTRREAFCLIAQGEWMPEKKVPVAGALLMLNHLARTEQASTDQHVVDNFIFNPYAGVELGQYVAPLDSLSVRAGLLASMTRDRGEGSWRNAAGLWLDMAVSWWRLSLMNTLYLSDKPLYPLYARYGMLLNDGEPYYASSFYNRTTLKGRILSWRGIVSLDAALDFNLASSNFSFYQRLLLDIRF